MIGSWLRIVQLTLGLTRIHYRVYKFSHERLTHLLAYRVQTRSRQVQFLAVGPHENFYRDLQRRLLRK